MNPELSAISTQACPSCGAVLATNGSRPGAWLSCPGCGRPVQVKPRQVMRPTVEPPSDEPSGLAWANDPRLSEPNSPLEVGSPGSKPWLRTERRAGFLHILMLTGLAGLANAMFAASFLLVINPWELLICWAFGAMVAMFVAVMVNTMRWGGREERRDPM